jgi:hypothetical protein
MRACDFLIVGVPMRRGVKVEAHEDDGLPSPVLIRGFRELDLGASLILSPTVCCGSILSRCRSRKTIRRRRQTLHRQIDCTSAVARTLPDEMARLSGRGSVIKRRTGYHSVRRLISLPAEQHSRNQNAITGQEACSTLGRRKRLPHQRRAEARRQPRRATPLEGSAPQNCRELRSF